jgi:hypothetical protein
MLKYILPTNLIAELLTRIFWMVALAAGVLEKTGGKNHQGNILLKVELKEGVGKNAECIGI